MGRCSVPFLAEEREDIMILRLYNINECKKKIGKSLRSTVLELNGTVLQGTTVLSPSFRVSLTTGNINSFNYAYVPQYGRYYYITERTFVGGSVWMISMRVDPLKSHSSKIGNSYALVARTSNSNQYNANISDAMYPVSVNTLSYSAASSVDGGYIWNSSDKAFDSSYSARNYVITIAAGSVQTTNSQGTRVQVPSPTGMTYLVTNIDGIKAFLTSVASSWSDVLQYIIEVRWFPFVADHGNDYVSSIHIGNNTDVAINTDQDSRIYLLTEINKTIHFTATLPNEADMNGYECMPPYGHLFVEMKPFGTIPLSLAYIRQMDSQNRKVSFVVKSNVISGAATLSYYGGAYSSSIPDTSLKHLATAQICISVPTVGSHGIYAAVSSIAGGTLSAASAGAIAGGKAGGGYGAAIGGAIGAVAGFAISASTYHDAAMATSGGSSSIVSESPIVWFTLTPILVTTDMVEKRGLPCGKWLEISVFQSGDYIQCDEVDLDTSGMEDAEIDEIESWLKEGVYV